MYVAGGCDKRLLEYSEIGGEKKTTVVKNHNEEAKDEEIKDKSDIVEG